MPSASHRRFRLEISDGVVLLSAASSIGYPTDGPSTPAVIAEVHEAHDKEAIAEDGASGFEAPFTVDRGPQRIDLD